MIGRWHEHGLRVGPVDFLLRSPLARPIADVRRLYRGYPALGPDSIYDYTVAVVPDGGLRRLFRPRLHLRCDVEMPGMVPIPPHLGLLALEMGMNLQIAVAARRRLVLHAGSVARGPDGLILIGDSGAGKSTLSASLGWTPDRWRFMGDEFALLALDSHQLQPFPRPISLKNQSIAVMEARVAEEHFGPVQRETVKGTIRHLRPPQSAIDTMNETACPRLLIAPRFEAGAAPAVRRMGAAESFARLTTSSPNYVALGEAGFDALTRLVNEAPGYDIRYGSTEDGLALVEQLWGDHVGT